MNHIMSKLLNSVAAHIGESTMLTVFVLGVLTGVVANAIWYFIAKEINL